MIDSVIESDGGASRKQREQKQKVLATETAKAYARLFHSADGKRVLADLRSKFGHERSRFDLGDPSPSPIRAAMIDGQCHVMREIEQACKAGGIPV